MCIIICIFIYITALNSRLLGYSMCNPFQKTKFLPFLSVFFDYLSYQPDWHYSGHPFPASVAGHAAGCDCSHPCHGKSRSGALYSVQWLLGKRHIQPCRVSTVPLKIQKSTFKILISIRCYLFQDDVLLLNSINIMNVTVSYHI